MPIDRHIQIIRGLDVEGLQKARREAVRLAKLEERLEITDLEPARKAGKAIKKYIKRRLDPHRVDFPGEQAGFHMLYAPPRLSVGLRFEIWPHTPGSNGYSMPARPILSGTIGAYDGDQLDRLLDALKEAADVIAKAVLKGPEDE